MKTKYGDERKLGTLLECKKEGCPLFVILYICKGNFRPDLKNDYLSYESLEKCIKLVNILYKGRKVACTFLGASKFDGNSDKEKIFEIINNNSKDIDLFVYDYEQKSKSEELKQIYTNEKKIKEIDLEKYYDVVKKRKKEADERFKNNGHARY